MWCSINRHVRAKALSQKSEAAWDEIRRLLEKWRGGDLCGPDPVAVIESALRAVVERCVEIAGEHMTVGKMIADKIRREFLE